MYTGIRETIRMLVLRGDKNGKIDLGQFPEGFGMAGGDHNRIIA
jgi:hypothetical protein